VGRDVHLEADHKRKIVRKSYEKNVAADNNDSFSIGPKIY
jgi:hypothetical protein